MASAIPPKVAAGHIMEPVGYNQARLRRLNEARIAASGEYASGFCNDLDVNSFLDDAYVERLPTIAASRSGRPA